MYGQVTEREHADNYDQHLSDVTSCFNDRQDTTGRHHRLNCANSSRLCVKSTVSTRSQGYKSQGKVKDLNTMTKTKAKRLKMSAGILDASDVLEDSKTTQTIISLYNIFRLPRNKLTRFRCELL